MSARSASGTTLIEILIAVSLLSLLSVGMLIAMHLGLNTMQKTDVRMVSNRRVVNARKIIESEIEGFTYSNATFHPNAEVFQTIPFFQAEPQSMRFVSSFSLEDAWRGRPQVTSLQVVPGERNEGVRLIVNETPYTGPLQTGLLIMTIEAGQADAGQGRSTTHYAPIAASAQSFVLADRLQFCRFSYLEQLPVAPFQVWRGEWPFPERLPHGIRIEMAPLDTTPSDLHVTTVTTPINVSLTPGATYADQP